MNSEIIKSVGDILSTNGASYADLIAHVNHLLIDDFPQLINILYRMDVSEEKLKTLLKENPDTDAATIIVNLMIEREEQRRESLKNFNMPKNDGGGDERW